MSSGCKCFSFVETAKSEMNYWDMNVLEAISKRTNEQTLPAMNMGVRFLSILPAHKHSAWLLLAVLQDRGPAVLGHVHTDERQSLPQGACRETGRMSKVRRKDIPPPLHRQGMNV